ncbi:MAG: metallophosphoesterase [Lachnospiraceae bacterium]|nr:metallophosphoesterase [Lachnospiraceae bacterium]
MKHICKHIKLFLALLIIICTTVVGIRYSVYVSYHHLETTCYTIKSDKIRGKIRFVMISDLHDFEFGFKNVNLVKEIKKQKPDFILVVGDIINGESADSHIATDLLKEIVDIAPVYYSWGNQEEEYIKKQTSDLEEELTDAGAIVLDKEYYKINIRGNEICLGGLYDYAFGFDGEGLMSKTNMDSEILKFLENFQKNKSYKIIMAHRPDSFIFGEAYNTWDIDLVLSGHNHGGQVILPILGGLYGGDQGFFPNYDFGEFHFKILKSMIITRGLSSDKEKLPRFNNVPEIVSVDLIGSKPTSN